MCYHAEFGRSVLKGVGINTRTPELGSAGIPLSWVGGVADPRYTPLPMCYHVIFGSSVLTGVHMNRKEHKKLGSSWTPPLGVGACLTP